MQEDDESLTESFTKIEDLSIPGFGAADIQRLKDAGIIINNYLYIYYKQLYNNLIINNF